jgi:hypothetical protein
MASSAMVIIWLLEWTLNYTSDWALSGAGS